uniref:Uncharacterized protein n=1 Tax=uncultured marine virus TaxID=186617 RepID=A0A0F7LAQ1_9VIRU|nr:hypothetical protein [uncultured marine virus]
MIRYIFLMCGANDFMTSVLSKSLKVCISSSVGMIGFSSVSLYSLMSKNL